MKRVIEQFELFAPDSNAHDDALDACEGAVFKIQNSLRVVHIRAIPAKKQRRVNRYY
jgi:hypothetical protein